MSAAPSPPHELEPGLELDFVLVDQPDIAPVDPEPIPDPEPLPDHDPIPFGIPDIAPLRPDPVPAPVDPPIIEPLIPPLAPAPANVAPFHPAESDVYRDELLYSLQLRFEVMRRRVLELESIPRPLPCPCQSTFVPPHSSPPPFARPPAPLTPFPEFDARFLTIEQQVRYLLRHVHKLEEELAHVLSLIFLPPPPPPSVQ
ncbi:hypothetical protein HanXRQr2_Chr16g0749731 [Helianthus annuus]|uniref:Uncharacterized protein n=1 Tax=Helianthus annuus TaxID=4232 RepID=A0A9K3DTQ6_HELAN|nr:hypothetical protein HanXRQr2_Chr16g0749731 [Helianthus annuus]